MHDEKGKTGRLGVVQEVIVLILGWMVAGWTSWAVMWIDAVLSVAKWMKVINPLDNK